MLEDIRHFGQPARCADNLPGVPPFATNVAIGGPASGNTPAIGRDGTVYATGNRILYAFTPALVRKWAVPLATDYFEAKLSRPAIGRSGTIYTADGSGRVFAVSPNGTIKWRSQGSSNIFAFDAVGALTVSGTEAVYSVDTSSRNVYWIKDGTVLGQLPPVPRTNTFGYRFLAAALPVIGPEGNLYVPVEAGFASQTASGETLWTAPYRLPGAMDFDGNVYIAEPNRIISLSSSGALRWSTPVSGLGSVNEVDSAPLALGSELLFAASSKGAIALDKNGSVAWTDSAMGMITPTAENGARVLSFSATGYLRPVTVTLSTLSSNGTASILTNTWIHTSSYGAIMHGPVAISEEGWCYFQHAGNLLGGGLLTSLKTQTRAALSAWNGYYGSRNTRTAEAFQPVLSWSGRSNNQLHLASLINGSGSGQLEVSTNLIHWSDAGATFNGVPISVEPTNRISVFRVRTGQ